MKTNFKKDLQTIIKHQTNFVGDRSARYDKTFCF